MRGCVVLFLCIALASIASADKEPSRICETCIGRGETLIMTPTYATISGTTVGQPNGECVYSFCAAQGGSYRFTFCEGGGYASYDTGLSIQGPGSCDSYGGSYLVCNDDFCSLQSQVDFFSPSWNLYLCVVDGYSTATGAFTLAFRGPSAGPCPCPPCDALDETIFPMETYQTVSGSIQNWDEYAYDFCAVEGGDYRFTFCEGGGSGGAHLSIQGPNQCGRFLACNTHYCGGAQIDFHAPTGGRYFCVVSSVWIGGGPYTLAYRGPSCQPSATTPTTWGEVKTLYR